MNGDSTDGMAGEFNRMVAGFSSLIESQQRDLTRGMGVISREFERAVQRFSDATANVPGVTTSAPAVESAAPAAAAAAARSGVLPVVVVNDESQPIPVRRIEPGTAFGNVFGGILGGIGSFIGNMVGGAVSGFAAPITAVTLGAEAIVVLTQIRGLVRQVRDFTGFLIGGLAWFLRELFTRFYAAGVFPVSRLIATLLILLDYGLTIVLRHLLPFLGWARQVVEVLISWVGKLASRLTTWVDRFIEKLVDFLMAQALFLMTQLVRTMIETAAGIAGTVYQAIRLAFEHGVHLLATAFNLGVSALVAAAFGLTQGVSAALQASAAHIRHALVEAMNQVMSRLGLSPIANPAPGASVADAARRGLSAGIAEGRARAQPLLIPTTPPTQTFGQAVRSGYSSGRAVGERLADRLLGPAERPNLVVPNLRVPDLELPEAPDISPQLRRLFEEEAAGRRAREEERRAADGGVTLNGDVNVDVRADTVDADSTDRVARDLAERLMAELDRLHRQERFGRGLVT